MMNRPAAGYLLAAITLAILALTVASFFAPVERMRFGIGLVPDGANARVVSVAPWSEASRLGVRPGDVVDLGALSLADRYRLQIDSSPVGTPLTLLLMRAGAARTITIHAVAMPRSVLRFNDFIASTLTASTISLLIIALVVWRRPSLATAALVLYAAGAPQSFLVIVLFSGLPDLFFGAIGVLCSVVIASLPLWALAPFIVRFPEPPQSPQERTTARIADTMLLIAAIAFTIEAIYEPLLYRTWSAFDTSSTYMAFVVVVVFTAIAYRRTAGEQRRRVAWVLAGFIVTAAAYTVFDLADGSLFLGGQGSRFIVDAALVLQVALPLALGYAILRHRVLDIGFAINRTMVYGVMTALVVVVVSLIDWLTTRLLSEQRVALAVEALMTIGFGVTLNWLHGRTERLIDRIVFHARHLAEKRIEYRIGALEFASSIDLVDLAVAFEAPRILDLHSAAVFRRSAENEPFVRAAATGWSDLDAPEVSADSLLVSTLRSLERPIVLDDVAIEDDRFPRGDARPALAIPIVSQHELIGFALFGNRRDGALPDPEEVTLLARLCRAAGSSYVMVEARRWREHAAALESSLVRA